VVYEVYELRRPEQSGELLSGLSVVYPGRPPRSTYACGAGERSSWRTRRANQPWRN
jgi:hypothetical protein